MDEYLLIPFDLSRIIWILTANDLARIPEPVLSRVLVFEIDAPAEDQLVDGRPQHGQRSPGAFR